jgi:hypothetical protein
MNANHHDRASLKKHFEAGSLPTQADFADLIDSTLNLSEDGFSRTDRDGLRVHAQMGHDGLFSYYRAGGSDEMLWSAGFAPGGPQWVMRPGDADTAAFLTLDPKRRMGLGAASLPQCTLDVDGHVRLRGRLGTAPSPTALERQSVEEGKAVRLVADGDWKDITGDLQGCHGFEVMAGAGRPDDRSRFAMLHAWAFNTYHPAWWQNLLGSKRRIRQQHAFYGRRRERLQLRWFSPKDQHGKGAVYRLQIRSCSDYAGHLRVKGQKLEDTSEVALHVYLTQLWFQPDMGALDMGLPDSKPDTKPDAEPLA